MSVNIDFKPVEKETTPPRHYTIETLNNYLKNPFKEEKSAAKDAAETGEDSIGADDAADYRAIFEGLELGTEATRTGIIDNARKSGYIDLKKDVYSILPGGEFLIESLGTDADQHGQIQDLAAGAGAEKGLSRKNERGRQRQTRRSGDRGGVRQKDRCFAVS